MRKPCKVTLDGEAFYVNYGDLLLDGALSSGASQVSAIVARCTSTSR